MAASTIQETKTLVDSLVLEVREHLLSNVMLKMSHQAYARAQASMQDCQVCSSQCPMTRIKRERAQGRDIYGRPHHGTNGTASGSATPTTNGSGILVHCPNCSRDVGSSRFAQHLEKCLNIGGRTRRAPASTLMTNGLLKTPSSASTSSFGQQTFSDNEDERRARRVTKVRRTQAENGLHRQALLAKSASMERDDDYRLRDSAMQRAASLG